MALKDCLDRVKAAGGEGMTDAEAIELLEQLNQARERLDAEGKLANLDAELRRRGQEAADQAERDARNRRRHAALNIVVRDKIDNQLAGYDAAGLAPDKAILALLEGTTKGIQGGRKSVAATQIAYQARYLGGLMARIAKERPHVEKMLQVFILPSRRSARKALIDDVAREMQRPAGSPPVTGNADAQFLARVFGEALERARQDLNRLGADIGRLDGYLPHAHDELRVVRVNAEEWTDFVLPRLDRERSFPGLDDGEIREVLADIHRTIVTGRGSEPTAERTGVHVGAPNLARRLGRHRVLHFADADAWLQYNERFGNGDAVTGIVRHLQHAAQTAGQMAVLGPNPETMLRSVMAAEAARVKADRTMDQTIVGKLQWNERSNLGINAVFGEISGATSAVGISTASAARVASDIRALQSMAKLGGAVISSVTDLVTNVANMTYRGTPIAKAWHDTVTGYLEGRGAGERRELAYLLNEGFEGMIGYVISPYAAQDAAPGMMSQVANHFFRLSGLTWLTDTGRAVAARTLAAHLGRNAGTGWADLDPMFRSMLAEHGLDADRWDLVRRTAWRGDNGNLYLTPDRVDEIDALAMDRLMRSEIAEAHRRFSRQGRGPDAEPRDVLTPVQERAFKRWRQRRREDLRLDLELTLRRMVADESRFAIIGGDDPSVRRLTTGNTQRGTLVGEAVRFVLQFKAFPIGFTRRIGYRTWHLLRRGGMGGAAYAHVGHLIAGLLVAGYGAQVAKDALRGYGPRDPTRWRTLIAAAMQSGGAGIYGDFLFGHASRFGNSALETAAGPTVGTVADIANLWFGVRDGEPTMVRGFNLLLNNTPFLNLWYLRPGLDVLVLNSLRDRMSPGYLRRQRRRREDEYGQERLYPAEAF